MAESEGAELALQAVHEVVGADRQDRDESEVAGPRQARGQPVRLVMQAFDRGFDAIDHPRMDPGTPVQHAVDGRDTDTGFAGDVLQRRLGHGSSSLLKG